MKKLVKISLILLIVVFCFIFASCSPIAKEYKKYVSDSSPTLVADFSKSEGEIMYGATGYLYGLSQKDVPSGNLLKALKPQIACVKAPDGLQHPVGDVLDVVETYIENGGDRIFIYMQDIYPEWYYVYRGQEDYKEKVSQMMEKIVVSKYSKNIIYCPFNENDNGSWYGNFLLRKNREKFYSDWIVIYNTIKQYDENAYIAGPGFMKYNKKYIKEFLKFCKENNCMPNMTVWHELSSNSYKEYNKNYSTYRAIEKELNIEPLEICISEYGRMSDNGVPGQMVQFLSMFEKTKVYGCIAYWRLANNLCETAADNNTPNAAWWLYYWYGMMMGNTYSIEKINVKPEGFNGVCSYNSEENKIEIIAGGEEGSGNIVLCNLPEKIKSLDKINAKIESIDFGGLGADCYLPECEQIKNVSIDNGAIIVKLDNMKSSKAYRVSIYEGNEEYVGDSKIRIEAEDAKLLNGNMKSHLVLKKDITYASSNNIVNNIFDDNLSLEFETTLDKAGYYELSFCYGNGYQKDGTKNSRALSKGEIVVNDSIFEVCFDNTITNLTTSAYRMNVYLNEGKNTIKIQKGDSGYGNIALDFIDIKYLSQDEYIFSQDSIKFDDMYMVVVPYAGYYKAYILNGLDKTIYLQKGINYLDKNYKVVYTKESGDVIYSASEREDNISINVNVENSGIYALTIFYSSNVEIGDHDYNVQHVEECANIKINNVVDLYYFRSTFSLENISSRTIYIELNSGDNEIEIYNDKSISWNNNIVTMPFIKSIYLANGEK